MYFVTCFDERWMENLRRCMGLSKPAEGEPLYLEEARSRCFGYFGDRADAERAVPANSMDLQERLYRWCVIEHLPQGIHPLGDSSQNLWFCWSETARAWQPCPQPPECEQTVNFSLG